MNIDLQGIGRAVQVAEKSQFELAKLKKATDGFEAIFLKKLFSQMRASVKETQFGQTFGKEIYNDMFDEAMANAAAKSKTLGMGDMLYNQFAPRVIEKVAQSQRAMANLGTRPTGSLPAQNDQHRPDVDATKQPDLKTGNHGLTGPIGQRQDVTATTRKS
jgi:Rod binding domain-containing protein